MFASLAPPAQNVQMSGWVASLIAIGVVCASLTAIMVFVGRSQKLFTNAVGQVVETHMSGIKAKVEKELQPNGGSSLVDKVDKLVRSADDTNARLVRVETDRASQVPMFLDDHRKLDELHRYAHDNTHAIRTAIAVLKTAMEESHGFVPALTSVSDELKATRLALTDAKGEGK